MPIEWAFNNAGDNTPFQIPLRELQDEAMRKHWLACRVMWWYNKL